MPVHQEPVAIPVRVPRRGGGEPCVPITHSNSYQSSLRDFTPNGPPPSFDSAIGGTAQKISATKGASMSREDEIRHQLRELLESGREEVTSHTGERVQALVTLSLELAQEIDALHASYSRLAA